MAGKSGRKVTLNWVLNRDGWKCRYCRCVLTTVNATVDHIVPRSRGGSGHPSNLAACCRLCNDSKGIDIQPWAANAGANTADLRMYRKPKQ